MSYFDESKKLEQEMIEIRRTLHQIPELGFDLEKTSAFVKEKLISYGYEPKEIIAHGFVATIGKPGKTILLRADMDALPIKEESGLDFAATGENSHACGHDMHATMMLMVAKILKDHEEELEGTVKFMFQPAEEILQGSKRMIDAGVLEDPKVDAAIAAHVNPAAPKGLFFSKGITMAGAINYRIRVKGVTAHGAMPQNGIDAVFIASQIVTALQSIISKEIPFDESAVITTGKFDGPGAVNVLPPEVILEGTMRTFSAQTQAYLKKRMPEMARDIAKAYRSEATFEILTEVPPLDNNVALTTEIMGYAKEIVGDYYPVLEGGRMQASEDFAYICEAVPSTYFFVGMCDGKETCYPLHHAKVKMDESMMIPTIALIAGSAIQWLKEHAE